MSKHLPLDVKTRRIAGFTVLMIVVFSLLALSVGTLVVASVDKPPTIPLDTQLPAALQVAAQQFQQAIALDPARRDTYNALSDLYLLAHRNEDAIQVWKQAAAANPLVTWPLLDQARMLAELRDYPGQLNALTGAAAIDTRNASIVAEASRLQRIVASQTTARDYATHTLSATDPRMAFIPFAETITGNWTLVAIGTNPQSLQDGNDTPLWAFWQAPSTGVTPGTQDHGWLQLSDDVWVHKQEVAHNLVVDGNFERSLQTGAALGFPSDIFHANPNTRQIKSIERNGAKTGVASLQNDSVNAYTSFASSPSTVEDGTVMLLTGLIRSADGGGAIGYRWLGEGESGATQYLLADEASGRWRPVTALLDPPAGTTGMMTLLMNNDSVGSAQFDDILVVALDRPAQDD